MKVLSGIAVESFAHPDDTALMKGMEKVKLNAVLEWISGVDAKYTMEMKLMGRYIRVNETDMPKLYAMLEDVCRVLDYPNVPRVFMHRSKLFDWQVYIGKEPIIILTDFVLNDFDDDMLRFHLGCAVTALKAKTSQLRVATTFALPLIGLIPVVGQAAVPLLTSWARAATLTEDRGGLLACQNEEAAWRYMFRLSGIPRELIDVSVVPDYIAEYKPINKISGAAKYVQTLTRLVPWQNERLLALYEWYHSGEYDDIIESY